MKQDESSITSLVSAFTRAYHSQNDTPIIFNDNLAKDLIQPEEFFAIKNNMVEGISFFCQEAANQFMGQEDEILKWITQVQLSPTPLARASFCEKVLHNELMLGLKQYVILGAGLDTFSLRHPELGSILEIFEVDHPATQESKKKRMGQAKLEIPQNLHFVPLDFTETFSIQTLIEEGFDPNKKTFISLLGVSYYLTKEENASLVERIFAKLPAGSSIVMDYADENLFEEKGSYNRVDNMLKMAAAAGEPMKSCFSYDEMERMLEKSDLLIYEHLSPSDINEQFFSYRNDYLSAFETIHYLHAVKK
jgi:methyltransferase (TIGR00027 family)